MEFPGNFKSIQNTANTNHLSGVHSLYEVGQGVSDGTWPTNYKINQSLRCNGTDAFLYKTYTYSNLTDRYKATVSFWIKNDGQTLNTSARIVRFDETTGTGYNYPLGLITIGEGGTTDNISVAGMTSGGSPGDWSIGTSAKFRDPSQWLHVIINYDFKNIVETDRIKIYANGQRLTDFTNYNGTGTVSFPDGTNAWTGGDNDQIWMFKNSLNNNSYINGCIADFHLVDGLALDPSYFGFTHPTTKQWLPKKYTGEHGNIGFHLDFAGTNVGTGAVGTVGEDKSGNGNHFTSTNVGTHDVVPDSPTNNFATFNPYTLATASLIDGRLRLDGGGNYTGCYTSLEVPPRGHWYMETRINDGPSDAAWGAVPVSEYKPTTIANRQISQMKHSFMTTSYGSSSYLEYNDASSTIYRTGEVSLPATTTGDVMGYSVDFDNGIVHIYKNGYNTGYLHRVEGWMPTEDNYIFGYAVSATWPAIDMTLNCGQDPTFGGQSTALQYYTDANGLGKFYHPPPAGAMAICSENISKFKNQPTGYQFDETGRHQFEPYANSMRQDKFSPYIEGGYGIFFDGDDDVIDSADHASLSLDGAANNDFTIELWYWFDEDPSSSYYAGIFSKWGGDSDKEFTVQHHSDRTIRGSISSDASGNYTNFQTTAGLLKGRWNHIAFVGDIATDGDLYCWINGTRVLAKTDFTSYNTSGTKSSGMRLGFYANATYSRAAIISDFRMVSGLMVYDKTATTIDVPTEPLKNISGGSGTDAYTTPLLISANSSRFVDTGANSLALTVTSAPKIVDFSPYTTREPSMSHPAIKAPMRDISITGGSFNTQGGNQGYVFAPDSDDFSMGATDFTIECWIYCIDSGTRRFFWGVGDSGGANANVAFSFEYKTDQTINFFAYTTGGTGYSYTTTAAIEENTWNHIAAVRYNNHFTIYINGADGGDASSTGGGISGLTLINGSNKMGIGSLGEYISEAHQGYITDLRITKGKAVYTSAFTPPTSPLSALSKTVFLARPYSKVKQNASDYNSLNKYPFDETGGKVIQRGGIGANIFRETRIFDFSPYTKGETIGSFGFEPNTVNGHISTDGITAIGTSDYTLECWVYHNVITNQQTYVSDSYGNTNGIYFYKDSSHQLGTYYSGQIATSSTTIAADRWYHVAVVKNGTGSGNIKQYINGAEAGTGTDNTNLTDTVFSVGDSPGTPGTTSGMTSNEMFGWITDVRLTVGSALYTEAFTPPRYPLSTDKYVTDGTDQSATGPSTTTTYTVTVVSGTRYDGTTGNRYVIDGEPFETVTLYRGSTYRFDVSDSSFGSNAHPFRFSTNVNNSPSGAYTTGVTVSGDGGSADAYVEIVVANDAPNNLYYYCTNHSGMGGTINVQGGRTITAGHVKKLLQPGNRKTRSATLRFDTFHTPEGNTNLTVTANNTKSVTDGTALGSICGSILKSSGKWYWEYVLLGGAGVSFGIANSINLKSADEAGARLYLSNGNKRVNPSTDSSYGSSYTTNDIISVALDMDNGAVYFSKNGTFQASGDPTSGASKTNAAFTGLSGGHTAYAQDGSSGTVGTFIVNFGQDATFDGNVTPSGGTNTDNSFPDEDGVGSFRYAPPAGFKAVTASEKPSAIVSDAAMRPEKHFNTILYKGSASERAITGLDFKPDLVWIKNRSNTSNYHHAIYDSVRGANKTILPSGTSAETASTAQLMSFDDGGFTVGDNSDSGNYVNLSGDDYVAWCWKGGDEMIPNTDGTNVSFVSANKDAGFSIVHIQSKNVEGNNFAETFGHGLDKRPEIIFCREYTTARNWDVIVPYIHQHYQAIVLNGINATFTNSGAKTMESDSSVLKIGTQISEFNDKPVIFYCWHSVPGYSKIGMYEGNGNANGTFVHLGFKPAFLITKNASATGGWMMYDNKRNPTNPINNKLLANDIGKENVSTSPSGVSSTTNVIDFYSNGFKHRTADSYSNSVDADYIYFAFAEAPTTRGNAV